MNFTQIDTSFGCGDKPDARWHSLGSTELIILVGVTGVGKSRTVEELAAAGLSYTLLPNRRVLTDHLIIGALQQMDGAVADGQTPPPIRDRKKRFAYTRRYRELHPGGMAHALGKLWVSKEIIKTPLLFDGLRGVNEVTDAAKNLPRARFIALSAPDGIRIQRLLGRNDAFDQIQNSQTSRSDFALAQTSLMEQFPEAANLRISPHQEQALLTLLQEKSVTVEEVAAKIAIVSEERRNYDPDATIAAIQEYAPDRLCVVDTVANGPEECAAQIMAWLA